MADQLLDRLFERAGAGRRLHSLWCVVGKEFAFVQNSDVAGQLLDLGKGVRGKKQRGAVPTNDIVTKEAAKFRSCERVETSRWLIENQHRRPVQ